MKPTLLVSDLHLAPERPEMVATFRRFCLGPAREAARLYVLGDLFDAWVGDDQLREPMAAAVAASLAGLAAAGVEVSVMRGNRDLLLGPRFAATAGAALLPDTVTTAIAGTATVLLHGDTLCTDDVGYQRYRARVHDPRLQRRFLALPYRVRRAIVALIRGRSQAQTARKALAVMDVNAGAVEATFARYRVDRMVHGHTHRPAQHDLRVDGRAVQRWVLPDWYDAGGYLALGDGEAKLHRLD